MRFKVLLNNEMKELEVIRQADRLQITYEGNSHFARLIYTEGAHYVLEVEKSGPDGFINRKRIRAAGFRDGDNRQLWANGRLVSYQLLREGKRAVVDSHDTSLSASIPALVSEILVRPGDKVKRGDKLILLESMKMILPIKAPFDGIVQAVNCSPAEAVQPGTQLVYLEVDEQHPLSE